MFLVPEKGPEIETPGDEINVPEMLDELHGVTTLLATDEPPKVRECFTK